MTSEATPTPVTERRTAVWPERHMAAAFGGWPLMWPDGLPPIYHQQGGKWTVWANCHGMTPRQKCYKTNDFGRWRTPAERGTHAFVKLGSRVQIPEAAFLNATRSMTCGAFHFLFSATCMLQTGSMVGSVEIHLRRYGYSVSRSRSPLPTHNPCMLRCMLQAAARLSAESQVGQDVEPRQPELCRFPYAPVTSGPCRLGRPERCC